MAWWWWALKRPVRRETALPTVENGFLHPVGDVDKMAEQLISLFRDRDRLRSMGIAARRSAEQWPLSRGVEIIKSAFGQA